MGMLVVVILVGVVVIVHRDTMVAAATNAGTGTAGTGPVCTGTAGTVTAGTGPVGYAGMGPIGYAGTGSNWAACRRLYTPPLAMSSWCLPCSTTPL